MAGLTAMEKMKLKAEEKKVLEVINTSLSISDNQLKKLTRDLTDVSEDLLWKETQELSYNGTMSFMEAGRRLKELQVRHSKNKTGNFQAKCEEVGLKKMAAYTLIDKYELYQENKNNVRVTDNINLLLESLQGASQATTSALKKAPIEVKEKFFKGEIKTGKEIKIETEIVEAEIIFEGATEVVETLKVNNKGEEKKIDFELIKAKKKRIKDLSAEIGELSDDIFSLEQKWVNDDNLKLID